MQNKSTQTSGRTANQPSAEAVPTPSAQPTHHPSAEPAQPVMAQVQQLESAACHRHRVMMLRLSIVKQIDPRQTALNRCVIETLRNPVLARAVARGLRLHHIEKL